jgi:hypothetical protein
LKVIFKWAKKYKNVDQIYLAPNGAQWGSYELDETNKQPSSIKGGERPSE